MVKVDEGYVKRRKTSNSEERCGLPPGLPPGLPRELPDKLPRGYY